jgi:hypothetical protein
VALGHRGKVVAQGGQGFPKVGGQVRDLVSVVVKEGGNRAKYCLALCSPSGRCYRCIE